MKVSLIAAVAENGVIGRDNDLPWKIRDDMRFFVATTRGHTVIMGRLNYDAMGRPLPQRRNIVVTRDGAWSAAGCESALSVPAALRLSAGSGEQEAFIIGGAQIYALALPYADCFYRTRVLATVTGDVFFPPFDPGVWRTETLARHEAGEGNEHACVIEVLTRLAPADSFLEEP